MEATFRIALTADFFDDGRPAFPDFDLSILDAVQGIECTTFDKHLPELESGQIADAQGVIVLTPAVTRQSLMNSNDLLAIARFGVGYDGVDVEACTDHDVALLIASGAVDRPVAEATVGWMIALSHQMRIKDRLVRDGRWDEKAHFMGSELRDRTLGVVGFGGIARELVKLLSGFGMQEPLAYDPHVDASAVSALGARQVALEEMLRAADFVSIHCPLTESTRDLIATHELSLMKPTAFLINTARGGIVNEGALLTALRQKGIAGAAIDCFAAEPLPSPSPFDELDNVLLAPHAVAWTHELFRDLGRVTCQGLIDLALGRRPNGVVNPEVFQHNSFQQKWKRLALSNTPIEP